MGGQQIEHLGQDPGITIERFMVKAGLGVVWQSKVKAVPNEKRQAADTLITRWSARLTKYAAEWGVTDLRFITELTKMGQQLEILIAYPDWEDWTPVILEARQTTVEGLLSSKRISQNARNALMQWGIFTLEYFLYVSPEELNGLNGIGNGTMEDINDICEEIGIDTYRQAHQHINGNTGILPTLYKTLVKTPSKVLSHLHARGIFTFEQLCQYTRSQVLHFLSTRPENSSQIIHKQDIASTMSALEAYMKRNSFEFLPEEA